MCLITRQDRGLGFSFVFCWARVYFSGEKSSCTHQSEVLCSNMSLLNIINSDHTNSWMTWRSFSPRKTERGADFGNIMDKKELSVHFRGSCRKFKCTHTVYQNNCFLVHSTYKHDLFLSLYYLGRKRDLIKEQKPSISPYVWLLLIKLVPKIYVYFYDCPLIIN